MRRYLACILTLVIAGFLGTYIAKDPGYAVFHYEQTTLSMPLWLFTAAIIVIFVLVISFLRIFDKTKSTLQKIYYWKENRRLLSAQKKYQQGLLDLLEGQYKIAEYHLRDSLKQKDAPLIHYLSAAQAAHEQGAFHRRNSYLHYAKKRVPNSEISILLAKAQWEFDAEDFVSAEKTLLTLKCLTPKHKTLMMLLKELYLRTEQSEKLLDYLPFLYRHHAIEAKEYEKLQVHLYRKKLVQYGTEKDMNGLTRYYRKLPRRLRQHHEIIATYAEQLILTNQDDIAYDLLLAEIKKHWDIHFVRLYGLARTSNAAQQFYKAEKWLKHHDNEPELLLTLGQLALPLKLWGKAKAYLEKSLALEPKPLTYKLLGQALEEMGEREKAFKLYRTYVTSK